MQIGEEKKGTVVGWSEDFVQTVRTDDGEIIKLTQRSQWADADVGTRVTLKYENTEKGPMWSGYPKSASTGGLSAGGGLKRR